MTKKQMIFSTGLYVFCALLWTFNFFFNWYVDGQLSASIVLYGISAVCFIIAAAMSVIRLKRTKEE